MKWIDVEKKLTITVFDEEHEEHIDKVMSVEEILDTYTNEGCPSIYSNPEQKTGKWIRESLVTDYPYKCSVCKKYSRAMYDFCPNCGAKMEGSEKE